MSYFGQSVKNERFSALVPIERFYPDLAPNTVSNATSESSSEPLFQGTRILYWYHPDYVSNVDLVTDVNGEAYELFLYNAWGESLHHWTSNSSNGWSSPYRFNSKEIDPETGMHYYGARYHHPKLSVWMSVDPLAHETMEPYQYTANNPVTLIDHLGLAAVEPPKLSVDDGKLQGDNVTVDISKDTYREEMPSVNAVVLHRTVSSNAQSAINTSRANKGRTGFHVVIDKDGSITQINNLNNRANHVGKPSTEVTNYNSIGIEVVGMYDSKSKTWECLTPEQIESTSQTLAAILIEYNLSIMDIYPHEDVSAKTAGEGGTVQEAVMERTKELVNPIIKLERKEIKLPPVELPTPEIIKSIY